MRVPSEHLRSTWPAGLIAAGVGLFLVLASAGVIEGKAISNRPAVFRDAREWQLAGFGMLFVCAGLLLSIPRQAEVAGRLVAMAFMIVLLVTGAGTVWYANGGSRRQKGGSMTAFLDAVGGWFQSHGVHPVMGAFLLGAVIAFAFAYRRTPGKDGAGASVTGPDGVPAASLVSGAGIAGAGSMKPGRLFGTTSVRVENSHVAMSINGKDVSFPQAVLDHLQAGRTIDAIKELRNASGLDLAEAKKVVDMLAESPLARVRNR